jgi:flagellum-specific ATP synthase
MLAMDSVTRLAMAQREIGLAIGEPPTARGYTPSSFSILPRLLERAGNFKSGGSITAFYTVLVEGDDFNEPVSDNLRAILDGHIALSRNAANQGQLPAVSILESVSRLQARITTGQQQLTIREIRRLYAVFEESKDMIDMGVYESGRNPDLDRALIVVPAVKKLLSQAPGEVVAAADLMVQLAAVLNRSEAVNRAGRAGGAAARGAMRRAS